MADSASGGKFWQVDVSGSTMTTCWGKVGTAGQSKVKECDSEEQAVKEAEKLAYSKEKAGYAMETATVATKHKASKEQDKEPSAAPEASGVTAELPCKVLQLPPDMPCCEFGLECYRKNPKHFLECSHPEGHPRCPPPTIADVVKLGAFHRVQVQAGGSTFPLRSDQKAELNKWLAGSWDADWLCVQNDAPLHFVSKNGSLTKLTLSS